MYFILGNHISRDFFEQLITVTAEKLLIALPIPYVYGMLDQRANP